MNSVLRSIKPYWFYLICERIKTVEVGKTVPTANDWDKITYLYCSKDIKSFNRIPKDKQEKYRKFLGKVGARFVCDWVTEIKPHCDIDGFVNQYIHGYPAILGENDCLSFEEMKAYLGNKKGYDLHISDLKIYDKPKKLGEFRSPIYCEYGKKMGCWLEFCKTHNYDCVKRVAEKITRPPQSWQYVEEL